MSETKPVVTYFDAEMHTRVERLRKAGIGCDMGPQFGNMVVGLRSFTHPIVIARQEALEKQAKAKLGTPDGEDLPAENQVECNKKAVLMAVTGIREASVLATPEMLAVATENGFHVEDRGDGRQVVVFDGTEADAACRKFLAALAEDSDTLPMRLISASRRLGKIKDEEIDRQGKSFVLGRHVQHNWED